MRDIITLKNLPKDYPWISLAQLQTLVASLTRKVNLLEKAIQKLEDE